MAQQKNQPISGLSSLQATTTSQSAAPLPPRNNNDDDVDDNQKSTLEALKQRESDLLAQLEAVRQTKRQTLRAGEPLTIAIVGFGRFGQFIASTFANHSTKIVVTSRSDYTDVANAMGATYYKTPEELLEDNHVDVLVLAVSIVSFEATVQQWTPLLSQAAADRDKTNYKAPLVVDVLSVKEHARNVFLRELPVDCDVLCTHPMFGPDSAAQNNGWANLNFVYEKIRWHADDPASVDRMERFLSIWEEEGCRMVELSCQDHDAYAANSQFITHLVGRVLGNQGLVQTPIDTSGFQSVLKLIGSTTADSFDLFYGLYKYNQNSLETIKQLQTAMDDVVAKLHRQEKQETQKKEETRQMATETEECESPVSRASS